MCLLLIVASIGSAPTSPNAKTATSQPSREEPAVAALRSVLNQIYQFSRDGEYLRAQELCLKACPEARRLGRVQWAGRCLTLQGNCQFGLFRYREALNTYLEARKLAEAVPDWGNLGSLNANIGSLYLQMGDLDAAARSAEQGEEGFRRQNFPGGRSRCLSLLAVIRAKQGRLPEADALTGEAVDLAYRDEDIQTVSQAWDHLGDEYLERGELASADRALTEAFRVRRLHRLTGIQNSYYKLGRLRFAQGDWESGSRLLDQAIAQQADSDSREALWRIYHARGNLRTAQRRYVEAFQDFKKSLELARSWRLEVIPADFTRIGSEVRLGKIYSSFIAAGNRLYFEHGRAELARETFRAAEENRAVSLHALQSLPNDWRERLTPEYWEALGRLHAVEIKLIREDSATLRKQMSDLRLNVLEMEARAGSNPAISTSNLVERTQKSLPPDEVLLSFALGEQQSYLWAVSRELFRLYRLPGRDDLAADIGTFSKAVRTGDFEATRFGRRLYLKLFGKLDPSLRDKRRWKLVLDENLFRIPFGALVVDERGPAPVYLAERHSLRIATGAVTPGRPPSWRQELVGGFLGVGDAVYNTADPRWRAEQHARLLPWVASEASGSPRATTPLLARLAGSQHEIESCARLWNGKAAPSVLLAGPDATPLQFRTALRERPSVIHFATHFVEARQPPRYGMIALSLAPSGAGQFLSPLEITRWRNETGVVVLSGCSSGWADVLPASGLMGLTRAWLAAGARSVIASRWPTPDDNGVFFVNFYKSLLEQPDAGPSMALQRAQTDILRAGGWRSNPRYWATYFIVGDW